ncbi:hypothetical protein JN11_04132 [Mucilaginibacter frigoritolerans]|uniref:Uncharacterized protein n=2 Tax=Mucilaginibacter frigoritolerans TaxID=652788 RepID=A0A562TQK3_9SPHI|nr:hypothetical protein JN11_04132 [Mucilaginibacter frigoritolerans]
MSINGNLRDILIGLFTSSLVVLVIELMNWIYEKNKLSKLTGKYSRIKITEENLSITSGDPYKDMTRAYKEKSVNVAVTLNYRGEGEYVGTAFYEKGKVKFTINLDRANPNNGKGVCQYIDSGSDPDFGTYDIKVDSDNSKIYVSYSNIMPTGRALGYEIWEKNE